MKTMKQILAEWLTQNDRYDGFVDYHAECSCKPPELAPCCETDLKCKAGHLIDVPPDLDIDFLIQEGPRPAPKTPLSCDTNGPIPCPYCASLETIYSKNALLVLLSGDVLPCTCSKCRRHFDAVVQTAISIRTPPPSLDPENYPTAP